MKKYTVGIGTLPEDVVSWDQAGEVLKFELTDKFLPLEEGIVKQLGRENALRYSIAKEFHDNWRGDDHQKFVQQFEVNKNMTGSASDKLAIKDTKDWHYRWASAGKVASYLQMGYRVTEADEVKTFLGPSGNKHEISVLGNQELVLMQIPMSVWTKRQQAKTKKNKETAGMLLQRAAGDLGKTGFVPTDKDGRQWSEVPVEGEEG